MLPLTTMRSRYSLKAMAHNILLFRRLLSSQPCREDGDNGFLPLGFEGLGPWLGRIVEEIDGAQNTNNERPISDVPNPFEGPEWKDSKEGWFEFEISHPMPEWIAFVDVLVEGNYLSSKRDGRVLLFEDKKMFSTGSEKEKDAQKLLSSGFAKFAFHGVDLMRHLSRRDIQLMVATGCPSLNPKIITSSKRLRAYVHIDEGEVCSRCNLRGSCTMAFINPCKKETSRMIDVLRLLFVFGYVSSLKSSPSHSHLQKGSIKVSVHRLLSQLVQLSKLPFDLDYENSSKMAQNFGWDDIEMKKGDWMCSKCEFMNFAKNKRCMRCGVLPPRKSLKPGEWECPGCAYVNYRRNKICYRCECNRPSNSDSFLNFDSSDDDMDFKTYKGWKWKKPNEDEDGLNKTLDHHEIALNKSSSIPLNCSIHRGKFNEY